MFLNNNPIINNKIKELQGNNQKLLQWSLINAPEEFKEFLFFYSDSNFLIFSLIDYSYKELSLDYNNKPY
jgi:hypothetical protein